MANTRGDLVPARIYEVDEKTKKKKGDLCVECMFNPHEYTVSKSNSFSEMPKNNANTPRGDYRKSGSQTLSLSLVFDTYENQSDVSLETKNLWKFMLVKNENSGSNQKKVPPPMAAFEWGVFKFVAFVTSMTQKFTLFNKEGVPLRASVDVTFTQYTDVYDYAAQTPTSGIGSAEQIHNVVAGDRLDTIAAEVYGDASQWRQIAEQNGIENPLALNPGAQLHIPML